MCKACFEEFIEATGGMSEGADPPAYNADAKAKVIIPRVPWQKSATEVQHVTMSTLKTVLRKKKPYRCSRFGTQQKRKRKDGVDGEEYVPPGLEQEELDYEQQELAAVLEDDAPGRFTKVGSAALTPVLFCTQIVGRAAS